jgi:hypothetical protein
VTAHQQLHRADVALADALDELNVGEGLGLFC